MANHKTKTRIVLSFDDGRKDNYRVAKEILIPMRLHATFNITSGYISKEIDKKNYPCTNEAMSIDEVKDLFACSLFEIAGHGYAHLNTIEDWKHGVEDLKDWLGDWWGGNGVGIASPHSEVTAGMLNQIAHELTAMNVKYIRVGLKNQRSIVQRIVSNIARNTNSLELFLLPIRNSITSFRNSRVVYSVPILHCHSVEQVECLIQYAINKHKDCVLQFHSILKRDEPFYEDMFSWDFDKIYKLCNRLMNLKQNGIINVVQCIQLFESQLVLQSERI